MDPRPADVQLGARCFSLELHLTCTGAYIALMTNLDPGLETLLQHARAAAQNSYSPYSGFKVGAALRLTTGEIVTGTNVENVSYGLTICAERSALVRAVSEFGPRHPRCRRRRGQPERRRQSALRRLPPDAGRIRTARCPCRLSAPRTACAS